MKNMYFNYALIITNVREREREREREEKRETKQMTMYL